LARSGSSAAVARGAPSPVPADSEPARIIENARELVRLEVRANRASRAVAIVRVSSRQALTVLQDQIAVRRTARSIRFAWPGRERVRSRWILSRKSFVSRQNEPSLHRQAQTATSSTPSSICLIRSTSLPRGGGGGGGGKEVISGNFANEFLKTRSRIYGDRRIAPTRTRLQTRRTGSEWVRAGGRVLQQRAPSAAMPILQSIRCRYQAALPRTDTSPAPVRNLFGSAVGRIPTSTAALSDSLAAPRAKALQLSQVKTTVPVCIGYSDQSYRPNRSERCQRRLIWLRGDTLLRPNPFSLYSPDGLVLLTTDADHETAVVPVGDNAEFQEAGESGPRLSKISTSWRNSPALT